MTRLYTNIYNFIRCRIFSYLMLILLNACIEKDVYQPPDEENSGIEYVSYLYPYSNEVMNVVSDIIIETNDEVDPARIKTEIPVLKYNKSWLFMLTQDDCKHAAYSTTWAVINGKPLSKNYYYGTEQLAAGDLPPDVFNLEKTLGSTDGAGNEVRFAFTTTVSPEWDWMDDVTEVKRGFTNNYYRFHMKKGLTWNNLSEMLTYDTGIAFHDVNTTMVNQKDSILKHFTLSQQIILNKLQGRGCKMLAEPNGNETYTTAALNYSPIRLMTAERSSSAGTQVVKLFPFKIDSNLSKHVILRTFYNSPYDIVSYIERQMKFDKEEREAVHVGVHATDATFAQFLLWLNNKYGKDGDDTVWFPSMEEFYEYNYYRVQGNITRQVEKNKIKLTISLPSENYFYYPSVTINLSGIKKEQIKLITIDDKVKGFSFANYGEGIMLNIDYRRYLTELAIHFVEKYEDFRSVSNRNDALYFVKKLKDSTAKDELLKKLD